MDRHTSGTPLPNADAGIRHSVKERRRRLRVSLHWEVRFCAGAETLMSAATENLSCEGFYCVSDQPVTIGDHHCVIVIPARVPNDPSQALHLHCDVQVLRVEPQPSERFGIAARIRSYHAVATA